MGVLTSPAPENSGPALGTTNNRYSTFQAETEPNVSETSSPTRTSYNKGLAVSTVLACALVYFVSTSSPTPVSDDISGKIEVSTIDSYSQPSILDTDLSAVRDTLSSSEYDFMHGVSKEKLQEFQRAYSSKPHICGSKQDYATAVYTAEKLESFGIRAEIKEYYTLLSLPIHRHLSIVSPSKAAKELDLNEPPVEGDACTSDETAEPPFLAYSATGNVSSSVVYVNYGRPEDFQWLVDHNVSLEGKIALARYGAIVRGNKVLMSEKHGMVGTLIYSDPADDGFVLGDVYPDGPWRPEDSFQRGSTSYISIATGDPLTPGFPSTIDAPRIDYEDAAIPHIPALPLSYGQAKYILASMGGTEAPSSWVGGLSFHQGYRIGDDDATVLHMDVEMNNHVGPIWDVIGTIDGDEEPDELVLMGNHRDAWVCGAVDPNSGSASMLEIARNLGEMLQQGWKPRRTIKLASWDGEEYSLLGSTEYAEDNARQLKEKAVAYINVDSFVGSVPQVAGSPAIANMLIEAAKSIPANRQFDQESNTMYDQWYKYMKEKEQELGTTIPGTLAPDHLVILMGSGTDFTAFYQHLGIISANLAFGYKKGGTYGVYHSTMDSVKYMESFADPGYENHVAMTLWWGLIGLRLAESTVLPLDFSTYGPVMKEFLPQFEERVKDRDLDVDFSRLWEAVELFETNAQTMQKRSEEMNAIGATEYAVEYKDWNEKLVQFERQLTLEKGLPHRSWYKHVIFGPGYYEGYAGTAFPGIDDALVFGDESEPIQEHVNDIAIVVTGAANFLVGA